MLPASLPFILLPMDEGVILTFKSYYLKNTLGTTIAAIDIDSSDGYFQFQVEIENSVEKIDYSKWH